MSGFEYGNARLRAMKSRLLSRQQLVELTAVESMSAFINALLKTSYQPLIELALVQFSGIDALNWARRRDLLQAVGKIRHFYEGRAAELAGWVMCRYDVDNLKALLRGLSHQVPADEILASTLPLGELKPADLAQLAAQTNMRAAIDLLSTWRIPLAHPLLALRAEQPGADLLQMELALERWYFHAAGQVAEACGAMSLRQSLRVRADTSNLMTALRLVGSTESAVFLGQHFKTDEATHLFVGPGTVPIETLMEIVRQSTLARAIGKLAGTPYEALFNVAMAHYKTTSRLSVFEFELARYQLNQAAYLLAGDALGVGVLIGYLALKTAEMRNLHRIAQGLELQEQPEQILQELIFRNGA